MRRSAAVAHPPTLTTVSLSPEGTTAPTIVPMPIPFTSERTQLTLEYIRQHYDSRAEDLTLVPRIMVAHWPHTRTLTALYETFAPTTLPWTRSDLRDAGRLNVSAHYGIDRDGTVYEFLT